MAQKIVLLIAQGFADSGLSIALDVFRTANAIAKHAAKQAPFAITVASVSGGFVESAAGLKIGPTTSARVAGRADVVMVPGIWAESIADVDAMLGRADTRKLVSAVARAHRKGATVASSCNGAFLLGAAGLLDRHACTTTWWLAAHLQKQLPLAKVSADRALVVSERLITAGAVFAQADLALHLVTRFAGPNVARQCARLLLLDTHASQAAYMAMSQLAANDETVRHAESWIRRHLSDDFQIAALAKSAGVSARTLARRIEIAVGMSPLAFVQRIRVEAARHLLATTHWSLSEIAARVGYEDAGTLGRLIKRSTGATPRDFQLKRRMAKSA